MMSPYPIGLAITPLRMTFWGGVLCVVDLTVAWTTNGKGVALDLASDLVGTILIAVGVSRLRRAPVGVGFARAMRFVQAMALVGILEAIGGHAIVPLPDWVRLLGHTIGLLTLIALVAFCVAMRWLCDAAHLAEAGESWATTTVLFVVVYLLPLGVFYVAAASAILAGTRFHLDLGLSALLWLVLFLAPFIHLFISTSRMKRAIQRTSDVQ